MTMNASDFKLIAEAMNTALTMGLGRDEISVERRNILLSQHALTLDILAASFTTWRAEEYNEGDFIRAAWPSSYVITGP